MQRKRPPLIRLASPSRAIQIVATPGSGNGRALHTAVELEQALRHRGHRVRLELFRDLDRLAEWAAKDPRRFSLLICVGGDGTLDTAAIAAIRRSVPFVAVPLGFGNLFGRALGQSSRAARVVDVVDRGEVVHVDVGLRNGTPFLCQESYGLLSDIQERTEAQVARPRARWRRFLAYYATAVQHLRGGPLTRLQVSVDGRVVTRDAAIVTVANVETYGPWLSLTPEASPVDGLLDVFAMRRGGRRKILAALLRWQLRLPGAPVEARVWRGRHIRVVAPPHLRDEIEVLPHRLALMVSSATAEALARRRPRTLAPASSRRVA